MPKQQTKPVSDKPVSIKAKRFWAVRVDRVYGPGLAVNGKGGYSLFSIRGEAKEFRDELQEHLESRCSVIEVLCDLEEV